MNRWRQGVRSNVRRVDLYDAARGRQPKYAIRRLAACRRIATVELGGAQTIGGIIIQIPVRVTTPER
jgi:hypothetical protein